MHETAGGFACPLLRAKCPLLLCITPSTIKGRGPYLVYSTVRRFETSLPQRCRRDPVTMSKHELSSNFVTRGFFEH